VRAYNDWIADFCKTAPQRLFAAAILPTQNMDFALEELARVARMPSIRAVFIRPMFVEDRYLNHPYYDALWAELEQCGITAAVHATPGLSMKVVVAHGKASWMQEVLEKMEASTRVIPLLHHYPVSTEPEEIWRRGNVMLGFDVEERLILKLPQEFADEIVWGSRYPHHDATSAWDALARLRGAHVPETLIARVMGGNAARQFAIG
jgi:predicted TIM-barrel fold metal-dependent hydrolase